MESVQIFTEDTLYKIDQKDSVVNWILLLIHNYGRKAEAINYIFCSDNYLLELNQQHLNHDYYTDILTFAYHTKATDPLFSDIYISLDRVKDNAKKLGTSFTDELHRVMAHGILHLLGYDDHGEEAQKTMRDLEEKALALRDF